MTTAHLLLALLLFAKSVALFAVGGFTLRRRGFKEPVLRELVVYVLAVGVGSLAELIAQGLSWAEKISPADVLHVTLYEGLLVMGAFLYLSQGFLRLAVRRRWWIGAGGGLALILLLDSNLLPFKGAWPTLRPTLVMVAQGLEAGLFTGLAIWLLVNAFRRNRQPLHVNRHVYWMLACGCQIIGGGLVALRETLLGNGLLLLAAPIIIYVTFSHHLYDIRRIVQRSASYLAGAGVVALVYLGLFAAANAISQRIGGLEPWRMWLTLAVLSALLMTPLAALTQRLARRLLTRREYKPNQILGEYGLSISNILDLERLATVAIGLISEAMEIRHGTLFVVDFKEAAPFQPACFALRGVRGLGAQEPPAGLLGGDSPVAEYLRGERRPLTQYDLDLLPRFRTTPAEERAWLDSLQMDVYVPIYSKNTWIGLFGLGPKVSRERYFDDDLSLLSILADHTAVALENARLVEGLQQLNQDLSKAYTELDTANHLLTQLDRTKTEFINIISHELGTPLMHLDSYNHLMVDDMLVQNSADLQLLTSGMAKSIRRMYEIVETMLDTAKIDTHTLELQTRPVQLLDPIKAVCEELTPALNARRLDLEIKNLRHLPAVPADREALLKVFHHLVINAIKYTPDGGKITISGAKASAADQPGEGVEVVVADTGIGIDPNNLELIFLKFYQTGEVDLHSTDKTKFKGGGPGLGLTIARGIVEAHGGRLWAESPGCDEPHCPGSRFHIYLPLRSIARPEYAGPKKA
jgi:signal transduction histidine kinase